MIWKCPICNESFTDLPTKEDQQMHMQYAHKFRYSQDWKNWKIGDRIQYHGDEGVLMTKPEYRSTHTLGAFYADVFWLSDRTLLKGFMVCRNGMLWKPLEEVEEVQEVED